MHKKEEKHEPKKEIKETVSVCYQGYKLRSDKKCVREIVEEPLQLGNLVNIPYLEKCPPGYENGKKGVCSNSFEVPPEFYCPVGWIDNVTDCITTEPPEYSTECPKGKKWEMVDGKCVFLHNAKRIVSTKCPDGSHVEEDGHCWKTISTYDCTPETKEKKEEKKKEGKKREEKKKDKLRLLGEKKDEGHKKENEKKEEKKKAEILKEMQQVAAPRATKVGLASQSCERKILVEPFVMTSCPEGFYEDANDECWKEEVTAPVRVCASKTKKDDTDCPGRQRAAPKVAKCPVGTDKKKDKCVETHAVPPVNVCPPDWTDNGQGCTGHLDNVPSAECRPGLNLIDGKCVGDLVRHPVVLTLKVPEGECESKTYQDLRHFFMV